MFSIFCFSRMGSIIIIEEVEVRGVYVVFVILNYDLCILVGKYM